MRSSRPQAELFDLDCSGRHRGKFTILDAIAWSDTSSHVFKVNCGLVCILMRSGAVFFFHGLDSDSLGQAHNERRSPNTRPEPFTVLCLSCGVNT